MDPGATFSHPCPPEKAPLTPTFVAAVETFNFDGLLTAIEPEAELPPMPPPPTPYVTLHAPPPFTELTDAS
jgi:hypothetical protein